MSTTDTRTLEALGPQSDLADVGETSAPGEDERIASSRLRQVAEAIRVAFPRPTSERELVLIDVDPRQIHAFWTLPIGAVAAARAQPGGAGPDAPMVLRLSEIGDDGALGAFVDVEVVGLQAQRYVEVESACRRYRAELGLRRPDGVLVAIVASNDVALPPTGPALPVQPAPVRVEAGEADPREAAQANALPETAPVSVPFFTAPEPARPKHAMPVPPVAAAPGARDHRQEPLAPAAGGAVEGTDREAHQPSTLASLSLENVLAVSSFASGGDEVEFEINAELHVFGRARPGTQLVLFGRPVPLRPDGTFSVVRPLPYGALVLSSLLISGDEAAAEQDRPT